MSTNANMDASTSASTPTLSSPPTLTSSSSSTASTTNANSNPNWDFLQTFTPQFQAMRAEIESRLQSITSSPSTTSPSPTTNKDEINAIAALLAKAAKSVTDAAGAIPAYDLKVYEGHLKSLNEQLELLRATTVTKGRFAFRRKAPAAPSSIPPAAPVPSTVASGSTATVPPTQSSSAETTSSAPTDAFLGSASNTKESTKANSTPSTTSTTSHLLLSNHTNRYLTRADFPAHEARTDLALEGLSGCVVDLLPPPPSRGNASGDGGESNEKVKGGEGRGEEGDGLTLTALHVRNLRDCVLLLPPVKGSALLHDMERCVVVLGCHQFRMHTSTKIDILLSISSNPIIEHCSSIRFGGYPNSFDVQSKSQTLTSTPAPTYTVQDFSHIRATPSPNFSYVREEEESTKVGRGLDALVGDKENLRVECEGLKGRLDGVLPPAV